MADKALEEAIVAGLEAAYGDEEAQSLEYSGHLEAARLAVTAGVHAYLDALLSDLSEEAVEAACEAVGNRGDGVFAKTVAAPMIEAALRALTDGGGRE